MAIETYQLDPTQDASKSVDQILESSGETSEQDRLYQQQEAQILQEIARNQSNDRVGYMIVYSVLITFLIVLIVVVIQRIRLRKLVPASSANYDQKRRSLNKLLFILWTLPVFIISGIVLYYTLAISIDGLFGGGPSNNFYNAFTMGVLILTGIYILLTKLVFKFARKKF